MAKKTSIWSRVRTALAPAAALLIVAFFGGYALFGQNGVLAWGDYTKRLHEREVDLARLQKQRAALANRVVLLDPRRADRDYADELVRRDLGVAGKDEIVVRLR